MLPKVLVKASICPPKGNDITANPAIDHIRRSPTLFNLLNKIIENTIKIKKIVPFRTGFSHGNLAMC